MQKITQPLYSLEQTGAIMADLSYRYCEDMLPFKDWTIFELQYHIRNMEYREDPIDEEFISRPKISMNSKTLPFDCDDRAVCIGAYCALKGIPFRFVVLQEHGYSDFHHIYTEIKMNGKWIECDCTYPHHEIGQKKTNAQKTKIVFECKRVPTLKAQK